MVQWRIYNIGLIILLLIGTAHAVDYLIAGQENMIGEMPNCYDIYRVKISILNFTQSQFVLKDPSCKYKENQIYECKCSKEKRVYLTPSKELLGKTADVVIQFQLSNLPGGDYRFIRSNTAVIVDKAPLPPKAREPFKLPPMAFPMLLLVILIISVVVGIGIWVVANVWFGKDPQEKEDELERLKRKYNKND
jgi:hypothetical protein